MDLKSMSLAQLVSLKWKIDWEVFSRIWWMIALGIVLIGVCLFLTSKKK